jgi:SAM-dependent methyltransferase
MFEATEGMLGRETFVFMRCLKCGLVSLDDSAVKGRMPDYYTRPYCSQGDSKFNGPFESIERFFRARRANLIHRLNGRGSILDVGCGRGTMLASLARLGWDAYGCELSGDTARDASSADGIRLSVGGFDKAGFKEGSFDVISFWHVLEHLEDPRSCLIKSRRMLKHGGYLVLEVPNIGSWQASLFGRFWFHLDPPRHRYMFTKASLREMLYSCGFKIKRISTVSVEHGIFSILQSALNALGFRTNILFRMTMKEDGPIDKGGLSFQRPMAILVSTLLAIPAVGLFLAETLFRQGGVIRVVAERS